MGEHFVINHIKNRHQDAIDEIYERESTQAWLEETIQKEMKKEMKAMKRFMIPRVANCSQGCCC